MCVNVCTVTLLYYGCIWDNLGTGPSVTPDQRGPYFRGSFAQVSM